MGAPVSLLTGLSGLLLLLLSVAVLTVVLERARWWWLWRRDRSRRRSGWSETLTQGTAGRQALERRLEIWELEMRWGEPVLQAASLLAPLLGLLGTVTGLMAVLSRLGPRLELPAGLNLAAYGQVLLSTAAGLTVSLIATAALLTCQGLREWQIGHWRRALLHGQPQER